MLLAWGVYGSIEEKNSERKKGAAAATKGRKCGAAAAQLGTRHRGHGDDEERSSNVYERGAAATQLRTEHRGHGMK